MPEAQTNGSASSAAAFLDPGEAAVRVGVAVGTMRRWIREGRVPGTRRGPGGRLRIPIASVDELFALIEADS